MDIKAKHQAGTSIREIARQTGLSRNTIRKMLRAEHSGTYTRKPPDKTVLSPFEPYLREHWKEKNAALLFEDIRAMGYTGSAVTVRRFRATLKQAHTVPASATVRFETPPGRQAQVDWGEVGRLDDGTGRRRKLYVFVYVLGYSRQMHAVFTFSMKLPELIRCHQLAFEAMGGWPSEILTDNMAQVRLPSGKLNPLFADFAAHHGFAVKTHQPYRPRTKGKVERMVGYLKDNFLAGRRFLHLEDANRQLADWLERANRRVHGTTGLVPVEVFEQCERDALRSLEEAPGYVIAETAERVVSRQSTVSFRSNRYSVPPEYLGKRVVVESRSGEIRVRLGDTILAEHPEAPGKDQDVMATEHLEALWALTVAQIADDAGRPAKTARDLTAPPTVQHRDLHDYEELCGS